MARNTSHSVRSANRPNAWLDGVCSDSDFDVVLRCDDGRIAIRLSGEIDLSIGSRLNALLETLDCLLERDGITSVDIDMSQVSFCDSTGVAFLLRAQQLATRRGSTFTIRSASDTVRRVLGVLALKGMIEDD